MPFDRLVKTLDEWARKHSSHEVFAQIGSSSYIPKHMESADFLDPVHFYKRVVWADIIVSHAGMGSILTALQYGKPIIILPRLGRFKETRNDHQLASALRFKTLAGVVVVLDESELKRALDGSDHIVVGPTLRKDASEQLLTSLRRFINESESVDMSRT